MELGLQGKVAIVTGASKGIGKAIAEELAPEGVHIALCARSAAVLTEVAEALRQRTDIQALPVPADLSSLDGVRTLVRETLGRFGKVDILINNAGITGPTGRVDQIAISDWDQTLRIDLRAPFILSRAVIPSMIERKTGDLINWSFVFWVTAVLSIAAVAGVLK